MVYIPKWAKNALASEGPNGDPIAAPSICLYNILNIKYKSLVRRSLNSLFFNVVVFKNISTNINGFFKGVVSKKWINI